MDPLSSGIGAAGSIIGGGINAWSQYHTNRFQKKESELAFQRDQQQIREQNFYNSPSQQMARFKAAGLSPHLMYGQGTAGNMEQTAKYAPPSQTAPKYGDAIQGGLATYQGMRMNQANVDNITKDLELKALTAIGMATDNLQKSADLDRSLATLPYSGDQAKEALAQLVAQNKQIAANITLTGAQTQGQLAKTVQTGAQTKQTEAQTRQIDIVNKELGQRLNAQLKGQLAKTDLTNAQQGQAIAAINTSIKQLTVQDQELLNKKAQRDKTLSDAELVRLKKIEQNIINRTAKIVGPKSGNIVGAVTQILGNWVGAATPQTR